MFLYKGQAEQALEKVKETLLNFILPNPKSLVLYINGALNILWCKGENK